MMPVQVTIKDIPNSQALENHVREKAQKLSQFCQTINSCRVVIEVPQKHKHQGKLFSVHIDLTVPGKELAVSHNQDEDVYIAIRDAFHAIERQLQRYKSRRRGNVKNHDHQKHGYITRLFAEDGYGFIHSVDGNDYYFSTSNVAHPQFNKLEIGDLVQFLELTAGDGLQANRITLEKSVTFKNEEENFH